MLEEIIKYKFNNKNIIDEINNLDDRLINLGDLFINYYVGIKLNKEFLYEDNGIKSLFDLDYLNNLKIRLVSNDFLAERIVKLHLDNIFDNNTRYHDYFKAIIGGYILDSIEIDYSFIDYLYNTDDSILLNIENSNNYYKLIYDWSKNKYKETPVINYNISDNKCNVSIKLKGFESDFSGSANTKYLALIEASKNAYSHLEDNNLLLKMEDVVGYPDIDKCINQLQELYVKGFINEPTYKIAMKGSSNGIDVWKCRIVIDGYKESFSAEDTSKKNAKRNCAFEMLKYIMDNK